MLKTDSSRPNLLLAQQVLDANILSNMDYKINSEQLMTNLFLAFIVELGEFANELRTFKHWSKKSGNKEKALEEYVDALHFLLSITNRLAPYANGQMTIDILLEENEQRYGRLLSITEQTQDKLNWHINSNLIALTSFASDLYYITDVMEYDLVNAALADLWDTFHAVGYFCGFSVQDIYDAYFIKNKENHARQASGY